MFSHVPTIMANIDSQKWVAFILMLLELILGKSCKRQAMAQKGRFIFVKLTNSSKLDEEKAGQSQSLTLLFLFESTTNRPRQRLWLITLSRDSYYCSDKEFLKSDKKYSILTITVTNHMRKFKVTRTNHRLYREDNNSLSSDLCYRVTRSTFCGKYVSWTLIKASAQSVLNKQYKLQ